MRISSMHIALSVCVLALLLGVAYVAYPLYRSTFLSKSLLLSTVPYTDAHERSQSMLVLGDSTAVGVGAESPELSVAGRLAVHLDASVENYAHSGAKTQDVAAQYAHRERDTYDVVLLQIGANDVVRFSSLDAVRHTFEQDVKYLRTLSKTVIVLTAGDIGAAPPFRWPLSWVISYRTRVLRNYFMDVCTRNGALYVDIYAATDTISAEPEKYYAADSFHLNGEGYGYWFDLVKEALAIQPTHSESHSE